MTGPERPVYAAVYADSMENGAKKSGPSDEPAVPILYAGFVAENLSGMARKAL